MSRWMYDVYLSFRGEDTRKSFVDHLYNSLKQNGIRVSMVDDKSLGSEENYDLIERSRFLLVIFSNNYAASPRCMRELVRISILSANNSNHKFIPIFYDVTPQMVRKQRGSYADALASYEVSHKAEVNEWRAALSSAGSLYGWDLNSMANGYEYKFIEHINKEILKMLFDEPSHPGIREPKSESNPKRRLAILWDIETCCIPIGVPPEDVPSNILAFLHRTETNWDVVMFSAYADVSNVSPKIREGCHRAGMELIDVPNGIKDASSKAILVDLFLYVLDNPPPSSIMLISGDIDFSNALHVLHLRRYLVILVIPSGVGVLSALSNYTTNIWCWSDVVRGEGPLTSRFQIKEGSDAANKEESIESGGVSMGYRPWIEYNPDDVMPVQAGDLTSLKGELVNLLKSAGGALRLASFASEYQKIFKKPLRVSDYKASKLVDLLKKISDVISVEGWGDEKIVILKR